MSPLVLLIVTISQTFLFLILQSFLKSAGQLFCTVLSSWDFSDVFLMVRVINVFLRVSPEKRSAISSHIRCIYCHIVSIASLLLNLIGWSVTSISFLSCKVTLLSFLLDFSEENHYAQSTLVFHYLNIGMSIKIIWNPTYFMYIKTFWEQISVL